VYIKEAVRDTLQSSTGMSSHLQNVSVDNMADLQRLKRGVEIRRPKKKRNLQNDIRIKPCIARHDAGAYDKLQFLRAISHSLEIHSAGFLAEEVDSDDKNDDVNIDEQQQQQQQPSGPATSATAAADATSARSATCEVCLRLRVTASCWCIAGTRVSVLSVLTLWPLCQMAVRCVVHL